MKLFFRAFTKKKGSPDIYEVTGEFEAPQFTDLTDEKTRKKLRRYIRKQFKIRSQHIRICQTL